jgi:hypothetical protein
MPRAKKTEPIDKQVEQLKLENPKTLQPLNQKVEGNEHQEHQESKAGTSVIPTSELDAENGLNEHQEHQESRAGTSAIPTSELDAENGLNEHQEHQESRAATSAIPTSELDAENGSKEALVNPKTPTKIHLIDGEKGGVGKSLFARTLMQYAIDKQMKLTLVDADRTNADVSEVYPDGAITASFSEDEKKSYDADEIFNLALTQSVVVNLPAQVYPLVNEWISRNSVLEVGAQYDVAVVKWFVCTGAYDSVKLFIESLDKFKDTITPPWLQGVWGGGYVESNTSLTFNQLQALRWAESGEGKFARNLMRWNAGYLDTKECLKDPQRLKVTLNLNGRKAYSGFCVVWTVPPNERKFEQP